MMASEESRDQSDNTSPDDDDGFGEDGPLMMPDVDTEAALRAFMQVDPEVIRGAEEEPQESQIADTQEDRTDE